MSIARIPMSLVLAISVAVLAAGAAHADKPAWAGGGNKHERKNERQGGDRGQPNDDARGRRGDHFGDRQVVVVRDYYGERLRTGQCPPGLAKKRNGCMPPGQAKKWGVGRPLPHGVVYYELPPALVVELGRPPAGHKYVRVAADILLIAVGTGMVVDAIEDLGRM
jgi:Ni/Co efflux regulator RcnB